MSKSKGDFLTLSVLEREGFAPLEYRFLLLQAHYRSSLKFSFDALRAAQAGYRGLVERLREWKEVAPVPFSAAMEKKRMAFDAQLFDDLNMPEVLSVLFSVAKDSSLSPAERKALMLDFDSVLGLNLELEAGREEEFPAPVQALVLARDEARREKNWAESDRLRDELQKFGLKVDDTPKGTKVSKI